MEAYWSWILTAVGLTGFLLAGGFGGRKVWWCWYINIGCQGLWFTYAIVTEQFGFIIAALAYTVVFTRNAVLWTRERFHKPCCTRCLGTGMDASSPETNGRCWDCLGTGHAHALSA